MSGDSGPHPVIVAAQNIIKANPSAHITLVGDERVIAPLFSSSSHSSQLIILHAPDVVSMDDKPSVVLRQKQNSSMWKALELVKSGEVDACVSCGNTGALMAIGKHMLKTFPGIDRPAICKPLPSANGHCYLLDLGANINCTAEQLVQFAYMGAVLASVSDQNHSPKVGLLNIGEESMKGIEQVRIASTLLADSDRINYCGFVEGDDIYTGDIDVVVCDGFVGNIALKVSEGAAKFLAKTVKNVFTETWYGKLAGALANPLVNRWRAKYDPARYNGACFLGLQGTVIKSHGGADANGVYYALQMAIDHVQNQLPDRIHDQLEELFGQVESPV